MLCLRVMQQGRGGTAFGGEAELNTQLTREELSAWVDVVIAGPVGVLVLIGLWEPIVEIADRWADGGSLARTLPLTLFAAILVLVGVIPLSVIFSRHLRRHLRIWLSSHSHQE